MIDCEKMRTLISAWLDGELDEGLRKEAALHLESCERCLEEVRALEEARGLLQSQFKGWIENAPPPTEAVLKSAGDWLAPVARSKKRSLVMKSLTGVAALVLLTVGLYFLVPSKKVIASPAELIRRASANYLEWNDVELDVDVRFSILEFVARFSENEGEAPEPFLLKIFLQKPNSLLFVPGAEKGEGGPVDGLSGFDGKRFWSYDKEANKVSVSLSSFKDDMITIRHKTKHFSGTNTIPKDLDFFRFLSWDYMQSLQQDAAFIEITEITGPVDERAGRRVFDLKFKDAEEESGEKEEKNFFEKLVWTTSTLTIDAERGLVERYELDVRCAMISLMKLKVEVADVNQGLSPEFFDWAAHLPKDTPVEELELKEEDGKVQELGYVGQEKD